MCLSQVTKILLWHLFIACYCNVQCRSSSLKQNLHDLSTKFVCVQGALYICQNGKLQRIKTVWTMSRPQHPQYSSIHYELSGGKIFFIHNCAFGSDRQQDKACDFWSGDYPIKIIPKPSTPYYIKFTTIINCLYRLYHWFYSPFKISFVNLLRHI